MKYYERTVTVRKPINKFGKLGFVPTIEFIKTNEIEPFNKGKRNRFYETDRARKYLLHLEKNKVYKEENY